MTKELVAGALLALFARGPWIAPAWRHSLFGRAALEVGPSLLYEGVLDINRGQPWHHGGMDVVQRLGGTVGVELVFTLK